MIEACKYRSVAYGEALAESKVVASVGSKGDSYDNAMAEALNSVFKAELIDRHRWPALTDVLVETSRWIGWYNNSRLHSSLGYRPPVEIREELIGSQALAAQSTDMRHSTKPGARQGGTRRPVGSGAS